MSEVQRALLSSGHCCSDNEDITEANHNTKRQKMTEGERLTRCRERNRLHAKSTRERKKSQMDCLETRIEELVVEKKRLSSTASESSVASILMSLSSVEKQAGITGIEPEFHDDSEKPSLYPYKVESEDEVAESVDKIKQQISLFLTTETSKDKIPSSSVELEGVRREKNRMHAKQTRLRKKKMTQEMEVIISNLEKEVGDLQSGLISLLPVSLPSTAENSCQSFPKKSMTALDYAKFYLSQHNQSTASHSTMIDSTSFLRETFTSLSESSSAPLQRKRKHSMSAETQGQKVFSTSHQESDMADVKGQGERDMKLQWRQHISKNAIPKAISICSESTGSLSEGSGSEGDLCPGSAVHSLLHMGVTSSSSSSRGSGSGSDESDTASSKHATPSNQTISQNTSRTQMHSLRISDTPDSPKTVHTTPAPTHFYPLERRNSIQNILAACAPPAISTRKQPHWRLPERSSSHYSHTLAGPISAAVAFIYPTIMIEDGNTGPFKGYLPMTGAFAGQFETPCTGLRNQDFTIYDGYKSRVSKDL